MLDQTLLERYLKGELSPTELETFQHYLQQTDVAELETFMQATWEHDADLQQEVNPQLSQQMLQNIRQQISQETPVRRLLPRRSWQVAAAILLLAIIGAVITWQLTNSLNEPTLVINESNQIKKIELEDGSVVWLNRQTQLTYVLTRRKRALTLDGEAFFEVTRDSKRPFTVQTGNMSTTVLGTSFNIEAFSEDERLEVSLVTGKVAVKIEQNGAFKSWQLAPGEQLQYLTKENQIRRGQFKMYDETAWREGQLVLQKMPLTTALRQISRLYDAELQFDTLRLNTCTVTSTFDQNNSIDEVLTVLLYPYNLTYQKKGDLYIIKGQGCK